MRCKNCGAENNDSRYICEVCGSPLYDENENASGTDTNNYGDDQATKTFDTVNGAQFSADNAAQNGASDNKKGVIIIAVLVVILVAIIVSIIAVAHNNKKDDTTTESELTKISSTADINTSQTTTQDKTTTEESTTESTTTTERTTTTQAVVKWYINASSSGGGEVEGDGEYRNGDKVTLIARADDGYVFDGWYSNGVKVSNTTKYTFTANENASFSAVFDEVEDESEVIFNTDLDPDELDADVDFDD